MTEEIVRKFMARLGICTLVAFVTDSPYIADREKIIIYRKKEWVWVDAGLTSPVALSRPRLYPLVAIQPT
jgi:hypothetical protein